jgi:ankyrin repeat protein
MDLYEAARQGSIEDIESAVEEGCDANVPDKTGKTALWFAVLSGHVDACRTLIARGARVEEQTPSSLDHAIQTGHTEIVELLWPHCRVEKRHRYLDTAVSVGFHDIADLLVETREFEYQHSEAGVIEILKKDGFSTRGIAAFQQWERYIFVRRSAKLNLHRIFFDYALLLASKADRNVGLRVVNLLLGGEEALADVNCMINIGGELETPLTNAAEKGNLEILATLIEHPDTKLAICGKYNWPAFLHLLARSESVASEKGRAIAQKLSENPLSGSFLIDSKGYLLESVFRNVLQYCDNDLVKQVIDLVHGAAGVLILPLLIRANEIQGLKWILNSDIGRKSQPPPTLWVLLCTFFQQSPTSEAWALFIQVAEFLVEQKIWDPIILACLISRNLCFVKQFFYPLNEIPPREVAEETLRGLHEAPTEPLLVREWADKGFGNTALWGAIQSGIWKSPEFERLLSCSNIDMDEPFPRKKRTETGEAATVPTSPGSSTGEKRIKLHHRTPTENRIRVHIDPDSQQNHALQDYQLQLMLLEQQNKRRLMLAREEQDRMSTGEKILASTAGKSPLAWAASRNVQLVEVLLCSSRVNVNSQDAFDQTPLMHAIVANDRKIVQRLLEHGDVSLNLRDHEGRTAIFHAARGEDLHILQLLIKTHKVDFSILDCNREDVHGFAKRTGNKDVLASLAT